MWIVNLEANPNGSHNDHRADHITTVPDGWAMIPDDFTVPSTFPFVGIEAEDVTFYREVEVEKEVTKVRNVPMYEEIDGVLAEVGVKMEEYTEMETVTEEVPYTVHTVTAMTEGEVPEVEEEEPEPTEVELLEQAICDLDAEYDERITATEDAICELDMMLNGG